MKNLNIVVGLKVICYDKDFIYCLLPLLLLELIMLLLSLISVEVVWILCFGFGIGILVILDPIMKNKEINVHSMGC